ncbi:MAG: type II toxin-antitoxin system PemK/MazF family toxin [Acidobacteria bacterium]|nr:type II toxin-antitoxin system PemK/MazF family toxin [Acidobacteriota bacterium]
MTCDAWDVVTVPFPFTDRAAQKRRPALIVSERSFNRHGHSLMAMITSSHLRWPGDTAITRLEECGLPVPCAVRLKLFTLDNRLIVKRIGHLSDQDRKRVAAALHEILP